MIEEAFCSRETSVLLKAKGFHELCHYCYHYTNEGPDFHRKLKDFNSEEYEGLTSEWCSAPTHQMAMAYLRENHNIFIEISVSIDLNGNYHYSYLVLDKGCKYLRKGYTDFDWKYEDAVEAALRYSLTKLI